MGPKTTRAQMQCLANIHGINTRCENGNRMKTKAQLAVDLFGPNCPLAPQAQPVVP